LPSLCSSSKLKIFRPSESSVALARKVRCSPLVASLLEMSQFSVSEAGLIQEWIDPNLRNALEDLNLGKTSDFGYESWLNNHGSFGNVVIYGDYDVDGICSTVLAMEIFMAIGCPVRFFIPHRHKQGYGLHPDVISGIASSKCNTLVVVDCGTGSGDLLDQLEVSGISVLVFDHHMPGRVIHRPGLINPQNDGNIPARNLCATSVLWSWAFKHRIMPEEWLFEKLDLVALATLSDCMPLGILNRAFVNEGMKVISRKKRSGLECLIRKLDLSSDHLTENDLVMKVIPSLNAPGRMDSADHCVKLLAASGQHDEYVNAILEFNKMRRDISSTISTDLLSNPDTDKGHVFYSDEWHAGVISSVASNLCSVKNRPVVLGAPANGSIRGTVRVPEGGDALKALENVSSLLNRWGGHCYAAGFSVAFEKWEQLRLELENQFSSYINEEPLVIAMELDPATIDLETFSDISKLGPFGKGNPRPLFFMQRDGSESLKPLGKTGLHFRISSDSGDFLAFNSSGLWDQYDDIQGWIYYPDLNYWRGKICVQFILDRILVR